MPLQARRPPGHAARKALTYAADIVRLRAEGHSLAAIREALLDAGVVVSISTVKREVQRGAQLPKASPAATTPALAKVVPRPLAPRRPASIEPGDAATDPLRGKAVAEAYVRANPTHPLLSKERSK